jgi:hypothetical protein
MTAEKSPRAEAEPQKPMKELDAETAAMLEDEEVEGISGEDEGWWCPNPECKIIDE